MGKTEAAIIAMTTNITVALTAYYILYGLIGLKWFFFFKHLYTVFVKTHSYGVLSKTLRWSLRVALDKKQQKKSCTRKKVNGIRKLRIIKNVTHHPSMIFA